jgi:hypothetical protein
VFPLVLLLVGMNVNRAGRDEPVWVDYSFKQFWTHQECDYLIDDYRSAFGANLSLSTFDRKHELSPPSDSLQKGILVTETILNLILASLMVVASRRKFTPKKPQGE